MWCVACYMSKFENRWIQDAWRGKILKVENVVVTKKGWKRYFKKVLNRWESRCISLKSNKSDSLENKRRNVTFGWLKSLYPQKTSSIMSMLEQSVETRSWKAAQRLTGNGRCWVFHGHLETVEHLVAGCIALSHSKYSIRHNRVLMIAVTWAKEHKLIGTNTLRY